eukprot:1936378-Amphidinium_carterae.1
MSGSAEADIAFAAAEAAFAVPALVPRRKEATRGTKENTEANRALRANTGRGTDETAQLPRGQERRARWRQRDTAVYGRPQNEATAWHNLQDVQICESVGEIRIIGAQEKIRALGPSGM